MDPFQQTALNALEPFILLSKSANSPRAAADLVSQATSAQNTFVFAELLQTPNIQALQRAPEEYAAYHKLLQIFAWGTWEDYTKAKDSLPPLSSSQSNKLRQLTLLTLCQTPHHLTYAHLLHTLSIPDARTLEDLVISTIYAGLITAQLNPLAQRIDVSSVAPVRDLRPAAVAQMLTVLNDWDKRCLDVLDDLEGQIGDVRKKAAEKRRRDELLEKHVKKLMADETKMRGPAGKRGVGEGDEMDIDELAGGAAGRTRSAKRGGKLMGGAGRRVGD